MKPSALTIHLQMELDALCPEGVPRALGLAVSGGGDSMALLRAGADWAQRRRAAVFVARVDPGLRPEAAPEAEFVADTCRELDLPHVILRPDSVPGSAGGNLQAAARDVRRHLLAAWATGLELRHVALAHTMDDQAETVLMRLARGSGVDGLAAMAARREAEGIAWLRPFLSLRREALRAALGHWDQGWVEDPSNADTRFDRIKARQALDHLAPLGLDVPRLSRTATIMADARAALRSATRDLAERAMRVEAGDVLLDRAALQAAPFEIRARLLAHAMGWVASSAYRPRYRSLQAVMEKLAEGRTQTLQGCLLSSLPDIFRVTREEAAVTDLRTPAPGLWDMRWRLDGPSEPGLTIAATGLKTVTLLTDSQRGDLPRSSRASLPAVWNGEELLAAPLPDYPDQGWSLSLVPGAGSALTSINAD